MPVRPQRSASVRAEALRARGGYRVQALGAKERILVVGNLALLCERLGYTRHVRA